MRFPTVGAALVLLIPQTSPAQTQTRPGDKEFARRVNSYIEPLMNKELSGTLLVARGNRILLERSFGYSSYELGVKFTPSTPSNVASITKPLTDIIAVKLSEEKRLSWDDTVSKWLPNYVYGSKMTIVQLINHRAGVAHRLLPDSLQNEPRTAQEMVEIASGVPLLFEPGAREQYSSGGYAILAAVLEQASGIAYDDLLQKYVAKPVGAKTIRHVDSRAFLKGRAASAIPVGDGVINTPLRDLSFLVGAGSVYTTPRDLFLVMDGLIRGKYGKMAIDALVRKDGLHWNGVTNGYRAFADWYPADSLTVIYVSNLHTGAIDLMRNTIPRIDSGATVAKPVVPSVKPVALSVSAQARLIGPYDTGGGSTSSPSFISPCVMIFGERALLALNDSTFVSSADYARVKFISDSTGAVNRLEWGQGTWGPTAGPIFKKLR